MAADFPSLKAAEGLGPVRALERPIFRRDGAAYAMFYTPGYLCVVDPPDADRFEVALAAPEQHQRAGCAAELWRRAEQAAGQAKRWREEPFRPECLTLYMNNECNLSCTYCHTDPSPAPAARLELAAIAAAAEVVAQRCARQDRPFYAVFHGGGEPTLHRERVEVAMARLEEIALAHGVEIFRYVATNGVMSEAKARWLAARFDLIGLSCDGPPEVQNRQRPLWGGGDSARFVEQSGRILRQQGCRFHVRTTITAATLHRQAEIADYICRQFSPEEIHFEPVYVGGRTAAADGLDAHQVDEFAAHFWQAQEIARQHGVRLMTSGSRPDSIHGPYCHVFRSVLNLVPGDVATACFKITAADQVRAKRVIIGELNRETGRFEVDHPRVRELCESLSVLPPPCADCFNRFHCARECPDLCPLDGDARQGSAVWQPGFRCRVQKALAYATLQETAEKLWAAALKEGKSVCGTAIL